MADMNPVQIQEGAEKLLSAPLIFPDEFKRWIADFAATNTLLIPFSQIFGARINIARSGAFIATSESTASASYTDLATVGPEITQLADGTYLVGYGFRSTASGSISVNGAVPDDADRINAVEASNASARFKIVTLQNNNQNSVKIQYRNGGFSHRWLIVMRVGAP